MEYATAIKTARTRVEAIAFDLDPTTSAQMVRDAMPKVRDYGVAMTINRNWPTLGHDAAGRIAASALGAGIGLTVEQHEFFLKQMQPLLETVASECEERESLCLQWLDFASGRLVDGNAVSLKDIDAILVRKLVDEHMPKAGTPTQEIGALVASLAKEGQDEIGMEVLTASQHAETGIGKAATKALYDGLDPVTKNWLNRMILSPAPVARAA